MDTVSQQIPEQNNTNSTKVTVFFLISMFIAVLIGYGIGLQASIQKHSNEKSKQVLSPNSNKSVVTVQRSIPAFQQSTQPNSQSLSGPDAVTQDYYNWNLACTNLYFERVYVNYPDISQNVKIACPYNAMGVLTSKLVNTLQQPNNNVSLFCAQNTPKSLTFDNAVFPTNTTAIVIVHTIWSGSQQQNIEVGLQRIEGTWEISSIHCNP